MRILYFLYDHPGNPWVGGGGAVRAGRIIERLSARHQITRVSGAYPGADGTKDGVVFLGSERNYLMSTLGYAFEAFRFLRRHAEEYDVVVEDFAPWNPLFGYTVKDRVPVVLQVHHREGVNILKKYLAAGLPFYLLESFYPKRYRHVITVSAASRERFGLPAAAVISNGIDEGLLDIPEEEGDYLAYLGRIDMYNKGLDLLLKAGSDCPVYIAGKGKDEDALKTGLAAAGNYRYLGFLSDAEKAGFLRKARAVVLPSRFEGQGIAALEAAAAGKPLVVSDIPELRYVTDNGFGVAFSSGDADDLRARVKQLWHAKEEREEMGRRGRSFARGFTWERIARDFEDYLLGVLNEYRTS